MWMIGVLANYFTRKMEEDDRKVGGTQGERSRARIDEQATWKGASVDAFHRRTLKEHHCI